MKTTPDVHTEHCCLLHGCKYGDRFCPVTSKEKPQSHPCMDCEVGAGGDVMSVAIREGAKELTQLKAERAFLEEVLAVARQAGQSSEVLNATAQRILLVIQAEEKLTKQFISDWLTPAPETSSS